MRLSFGRMSIVMAAAVVAVAAAAASAQAASYRYAGAWRSTASTSSHVYVNLTSATVTDENNNHVVAAFNVQSGSTWIQGGVARGAICGYNPRVGGVWIYVEINTGNYPCALDYDLIYVKNGAFNTQYNIQITECLNGGGCGCFAAAARPGGPAAVFGAGVLARSQAQKPLMSRPSLPDCVVWDNGTWGIYVDGVRVAYNVYLAGTPDLEDGLLEDGALYTANDSGAAQFRSFSTTMTYLCDASHYTLGGCAGTASWITNNSNWNASLPTP